MALSLHLSGAATRTSHQLSREWCQPGHLRQALPCPAPHTPGGTGMASGRSGPIPAALKPRWHVPTELLTPKNRSLSTTRYPSSLEQRVYSQREWAQLMNQHYQSASCWGRDFTAPANSIRSCLPPAPALPSSSCPGTALPSPPRQSLSWACSAPLAAGGAQLLPLPHDFIGSAPSPTGSGDELWPWPGSRKGLQTGRARVAKHISREMFLSQAAFTAIALRNPIREEEMTQVSYRHFTHPDILEYENLLHIKK